MNEWTRSQFLFLLRYPCLSDRELGRAIGRSERAVEAIREAVHSWHRGGAFNSSALSRMMLGILEHRRGPIVCAACAEAA
jgi:hypothetical protein